jgi:hypothetical protein
VSSLRPSKDLRRGGDGEEQYNYFFPCNVWGCGLLQTDEEIRTKVKFTEKKLLA